MPRASTASHRTAEPPAGSRSGSCSVAGSIQSGPSACTASGSTRSPAVRLVAVTATSKRSPSATDRGQEDSTVTGAATTSPCSADP